MKKGIEFDFIDFIRSLDREDIRYLLIGRWAVILHGAPLMTADYDFWIDPEAKGKLLRMLQQKGFETPQRSHWKRSIISVYAGVEKVDLFFFRKVTNAEGQSLSFKDCLNHAVVKKDDEKGITIVVPSIEDLILLKKMPRNSADQESKDRVDLRYLQELRKKKS